MKSLKQNVAKNEKGIVSLIVTMIIMLVLSITVLGFARLMRREQQQILDRQLNTQAFYAAESGVNDAAAAIANGSLTVDKTKCNAPELNVPANLTGTSTEIGGASSSVSYSCLLVTQHVKDLEFGDINTDNSTIVPVITNDGSTITDLEISWQDKTGGSNFSGCPNGFPPVSSYTNCNAGVLRIDIVPADAAHLSRASLIANTFTVFLQPTSSGGASSVAYAPGLSSSGKVVKANCSAGGSKPKFCDIKMTSLGGVSSNKFYMRVKSIYLSSTMTLCSPACGGSAKELKGQALVDSTGKAQDVLKRIQVRLHTDKLISNDFAEFGFESSGSACKRFAVIPPNIVTPDSAYSSNAACSLN